MNMTEKKKEEKMLSGANDTKAAYDRYQSMLTEKPAAYQSKYNDQINDVLNKIMNKEKFSYNVMSDPAYQQFKDQYTRLGKQAMQDTMAQASTLTGGYGNSYASTAGNQAYQGYLNNLNDVVPTLQEAAYGRYMDEYNALYDRLNSLQSADALDYQRYRDNVADYYSNLSEAKNAYEILYGKDVDERNYRTELERYTKSLQEEQTQPDVEGVKGPSKITDVMSDTAYKTMLEKYDMEGMEGVYKYLDKQAEYNKWSDAEMAYVYNYLNYEMDWDMKNKTDDNKDWVKWDAISNSSAGKGVYDSLIKQHNDANPVLPQSMILTKAEFDKKKEQFPSMYPKNYSEYIKKLYEDYLKR